MLATAAAYGQGTTGKAVSTRFERLKKEEPWDLSINRDPGDAPVAKATPRKRGPTATPGTASAKKTKKQNLREDDDDDEEDFQETPSKSGKSTLNRVKSGRVTKRTNAGPSNGTSYAISDSDDETEKFTEKFAVKNEYMDDYEIAEPSVEENSYSFDDHNNDGGYQVEGDSYYNTDL